jgi:large subunit ribosomal protein L10
VQDETMNREEKSAAIQEIAAQIEGAEAIFAVDYRGISVSQAAELRSKLREADASFRVVKNRLTKIAADQAGEARLAELLNGPTALTFVRGDTAQAAKAITTFNKEHDVLTYKGGFMDATSLDEDAFKSIARLPAREVLNAQFAGVVASPLTGLVRGLGSLIQGLALQLGQIAEKGLVSGEAPAAAPAEEPAPAEEAPAEESAPLEEAAPAEETSTEDVPVEEPVAEGEQDTADTSPAASQPDSSPAGEEEPQAEQEEPDPAAPGGEAEEAGGTDQDSSDEEQE